MKWESRAKCAPLPKSFFFYGGEGYNKAAAQAVCAACPVAVECLVAAMAEEEEWNGIYRFGIRGGLTPTQRERLSLVDARYAVYPEELTLLEVRTLFEEVVADMRAQFIHPVDGFARGETVELSDELAEHYVGGGHALAVTDEPEAPAKKAPAKKAPAKAAAKKAPAKKAPAGDPQPADPAPVG